MANKTIDDAFLSVQKNIEELRKMAFDQKFKFELGEYARDILYKRTKSGKGVNDDEAKNPVEVTLEKLSANYIKFRETVTLGPYGTPRRSNLTLSGEMLESIRVRVGQDITLEIPHSSRKDGKTNYQVWEYTREGGRHFFALTTDDGNLLTERIRQRVLNIAKNLFA